MNETKNDLAIKCIPVNPIEMNLYVVYRKNGEGVIIDPGCCQEAEFDKLFAFTEQENIRIRHILLTHPHFDHLMGSARICRHYGLPLSAHEKALSMIDGAVSSVSAFGLPAVEKPENIVAFQDKARIEFAGTVLEARYTPGHCEGSVCFVLPEQETVFSGDVLFHGSIGRTDFPTGDLDLLRKSIFERIFVLDDTWQVRPGHGGRTTVGHEKYNNPFL